MLIAALRARRTVCALCILAMTSAGPIAAMVGRPPAPPPPPDPALEHVLTCLKAKQRLVLLSYDVPGLPFWDASKIADRELFTMRRCKAVLNTPDADLRAVLQEWAAEGQD
jgi:hypothetical protein